LSLLAFFSEEKMSAAMNCLRAPICAVLGHVDAGKTTLLDYIRKTKVQESEAGRITQGIGSTFIPISTIAEYQGEKQLELKVPGILVIDTPGHAAFLNLRSRGANLCDLAILVVDLMHGLEAQTLESIKLLREQKVPFIVALNKVDRCYDWKKNPNMPFVHSIKKQKEAPVKEFHNRVYKIMADLSKEGFDSLLYYENKDFRKCVSLVPTSAITGEGIPDLMLLLVQLVQKHLGKRLNVGSDFKAVSLELKKDKIFGTALDILLVNGTLRVGDTIVMAGQGEAICAPIKFLLLPKALRDMRTKVSFQQVSEITGAIGVRLVAPGIKNAIAGSPIFIAKDHEVDSLKKQVMDNFETMIKRFSMNEEGFAVHTANLGSLEALLLLLEEHKIPVSTVGIGTMHKKDVIRAARVKQRNKDYAGIILFEADLLPDAEELVRSEGLPLFQASIIFHLVDMVREHLATQHRDKMSLPCALRVLPQCIFHRKGPIIVGCEVLEGKVVIGMSLMIAGSPDRKLGIVRNIQKDKKDLTEATKGMKIAVEVESDLEYSREFSLLVSQPSKDDLAFMKEFMPEEYRSAMKIVELVGGP
jgi:translation initiation factor 5B